MQIYNDFSTSVCKALEEIEPKYLKLPGLVICGTHNPHDIDFFIDKIKEARKKGKPYLGICFGHQLAAIEYARNVLRISDATSEEFGQGTFVVKKRKNLKIGLNKGQSYWNNYEVVIDWEKPKNFFTTQFHPEYQSSIDKPHPILKDFINYSKKENLWT